MAITKSPAVDWSTLPPTLPSTSKRQRPSRADALTAARDSQKEIIKRITQKGFNLSSKGDRIHIGGRFDGTISVSIFYQIRLK